MVNPYSDWYNNYFQLGKYQEYHEFVFHFTLCFEWHLFGTTRIMDGIQNVFFYKNHHSKEKLHYDPASLYAFAHTNNLHLYTLSEK